MVGGKTMKKYIYEFVAMYTVGVSSVWFYLLGGWNGVFWKVMLTIVAWIAGWKLYDKTLKM